MSYYPVTIQRQDPDTEEWTDLLHLHALKVNKTGGGETTGAGAEQFHPRLTSSCATARCWRTWSTTPSSTGSSTAAGPTISRTMTTSWSSTAPCSW